MKRMAIGAMTILSLFLLSIMLFASAQGYRAGKSSVMIVGSESMRPLMEEIIERYDAAKLPNKLRSIRLETPDTEAGIQALKDHVANFALCARADSGQSVLEVNLSGLTLCYDLIAVIVHPSNPIQSLSLEDLAKLYRGETRRWATLSGLDTGFVHAYSRPWSSGTRFSFERELPSGASVENRIHALAFSDADMVKKVMADPSGIGYVSYAYLMRKLDNEKLAVRPLLVEGVAPWDMLGHAPPHVDGDMQPLPRLSEPPQVTLYSEATQWYPFIRPFRLLMQKDEVGETRGDSDLELEGFLAYIQDGSWRVGNSILDHYMTDLVYDKK